MYVHDKDLQSCVWFRRRCHQNRFCFVRMDKVVDITFSLEHMDLKAGSSTADASHGHPVRTSVLWGSGQAEASLQALSLMA